MEQTKKNTKKSKKEAKKTIVIALIELAPIMMRVTNANAVSHRHLRKLL